MAETVAVVTEDNILSASGVLDPARSHTELRLADGQVLRISTSFLLQYLETGTPHLLQSTVPEGSLVVPVIEERLEIAKRTVITGKVQIDRRVEEYDQRLDIPLASRTFDVERVRLDQPVETAPAVRQEGDTTIYSLVEEQLVLTTQLILTEELRVTKRDAEHHDTRTVTLRRDVVEVTRTSGS